MAKVGRPSKYSDELADLICTRIACGESLRTICFCDGMPHIDTVFTWLKIHPVFTDKYTRAREAQADYITEEMLDVARTKSSDQIDNQDKRLLIDTLKWRAGKLRPKVYGEKIVAEHTGEDGGPIKTEQKHIFSGDALSLIDKVRVASQQKVSENPG